MTAVWSPISHWNLSLTYGFDHTEILTGCPSFATPPSTVLVGCYINTTDPNATAIGAKPAGPAAGGLGTYQSVKGNELPGAPENKVAFNTPTRFISIPAI